MTDSALWKRTLDRRSRIRCPAPHCDRPPSADPDRYRALRRVAYHLLNAHRPYLKNRGEYASAYRLWLGNNEFMVRAWLDAH